ncbi:tyrosine-type recombinase/integrase [Romboutsia sp. 1001216sp1]|uniref:tyrosine-type recombinase/integrase n=1 Tax=unclassified Romboutsia TaxID=2626894 RepID=UPI00189D15CF|nr:MULTISPECIES: tyrosine-type recombinase/integrase [unclassified Romboutsia]MDB8802753.1 tyrosine-type recombinase/integrase [Romboutsia sp. 1001216sp1]MDB8814150.1 tyrosine-type recombinase/integrase [Romboutsia sp. 1001216sp1]
MTMRPLEVSEYKEIIELIQKGFTYAEGNKEKHFRANTQMALALTLQANIGLRIGDVLELKLANFKGNKLEVREDKTDKLQYRDINSAITQLVLEYALDKRLNKSDNLFNIGVRAIQKQLKIICNYLGLENISTHSFRKMYATLQYEANNHNLELIKELLNHSSISTTQRYIRVSQQAINKASSDFFID